MRIRDVSALTVVDSGGTFAPQIYISTAYGSGCPEIASASAPAARSLALSDAALPENEIITRAGESSLRRARVSAPGIGRAFQRHESIGNARGSKSVRQARMDAEPFALARRTTTPSSATSVYSVGCLLADRGTVCHALGTAPACAVEKRGGSGA